MRMRTLLLVLVLIAAALTACNRSYSTQPLATSTPIQIANGTPLAPPTAIPPTRPPATRVPTLEVFATQPPASAASATPGPYTPIAAVPIVDGLLLRSNPGYLFPPLMLLAQNTGLTVLGQSPGGEWYSVRAEDGSEGWVFGQLISSESPLGTSPVIKPEDALLVSGRVQDATGAPVSGLQFTITRGGGQQSERNDAVAGADGLFYLYMPSDTTGEWTIEMTAISCTSSLMGAGCTCKVLGCGAVDPPSLKVTLPLKQPVTFTAH